MDEEMDFETVVTQRRSVRKFLPQALPEAVVSKAIDMALVAPNSSNMQLWEFHRVRSTEIKSKISAACFDQPAASTAAELIVVVSRYDHWRRNQQMMLKVLEQVPGLPKAVLDYYRKLVPLFYFTDPLRLTSWLRLTLFSTVGLFRPVPRGPYFRVNIKEVLGKSAALACENLMLSLTDQGYGSCPMEGFDEHRVKSLLRLPCSSRVVMVIGAGAPAPDGVYGPRVRFDRKLFVFDH